MEVKSRMVQLLNSCSAVMIYPLSRDGLGAMLGYGTFPSHRLSLAGVLTKKVWMSSGFFSGVHIR